MTCLSFTIRLVLSPPGAHFTKMCGGTQDKGHEYGGRELVKGLFNSRSPFRFIYILS